MKKLFMATLATSVIALSGCASSAPANPNTTANTINTGFDIGKTVFQTAVNNRCRSELTNHKLWKVAKTFYNTTRQQQIQTNVCSCVSTNSVNNITNAELMTAAIDPNIRNQMVVTAVANSINSCYGEVIKSFKTL